MYLLSKDWEKIYNTDSFKRLGEAKWNPTENRCEIWAAIHFKVIYAETGFSESLQKYIVAIEKSAHELEWGFTRKTDSLDSDKK